MNKKKISKIKTTNSEIKQQFEPARAWLKTSDIKRCNDRLQQTLFFLLPESNWYFLASIFYIGLGFFLCVTLDVFAWLWYTRSVYLFAILAIFAMWLDSPHLIAKIKFHISFLRDDSMWYLIAFLLSAWQILFSFICILFVWYVSLWQPKSVPSSFQ